MIHSIAMAIVIKLEINTCWIELILLYLYENDSHSQIWLVCLDYIDKSRVYHLVYKRVQSI